MKSHYFAKLISMDRQWQERRKRHSHLTKEPPFHCLEDQKHLSYNYEGWLHNNSTRNMKHCNAVYLYLNIYLFYVHVYVSKSTCIYHMRVVPMEAERRWGLLGQELQALVSYHVGSENWIKEPLQAHPGISAAEPISSTLNNGFLLFSFFF